MPYPLGRGRTSSLGASSQASGARLCTHRVVSRVWLQQRSTCRRVKLDPYLTPHIKTSSTWKKTGKPDIGFCNDSLDVAPKAQATEAKLDTLDFIKMKNGCIKESAEAPDWTRLQPC